MATVKSETVDVGGASARAVVMRPEGAKNPPVVIAWSDIFQLTPPHLRMVRRLAGHGFTVIAPEIYGRIEPPGTVLDFERDRQRALDDAGKLEVAWIDEERRALIDRAKKEHDRVGVWGFCFGGHLAFRAASDPRVAASACFYPTGVHDGNLGAAKGTADTLARAKEIAGEMLLVFGSRDPHVSEAGRANIVRALRDARVRHEVQLFDAEHAFARDEGPRWDPEATDRAFAATLGLFRRALA